MLNSNSEAQTNRTAVASVAGWRDKSLAEDMGRSRGVALGVTVDAVLTRVRSILSFRGMAEEKMPEKRRELASVE